MTFKLFREAESGDAYAANDLDHAKRLMVELVGEEAALDTEWSEVPGAKVITVNCDGETIAKTAAEWANDEPTPGVRFGTEY